MILSSTTFVGAMSTRNTTLLKLTVRQLELYRAGLRGSGEAWAHIPGGTPDTGRWSSGNCWDAMGMARTLATVSIGPYDTETKSVISKNLIDWIKEIIDGARSSPVSKTLRLSVCPYSRLTSKARFCWTSTKLPR